MGVILSESLIVSKVRKQHRKRHLGYFFQGSSTASAPLALIQSPGFLPASPPASSTGTKQASESLLCAFHLPETKTQKMKMTIFTVKILALYSVIQVKRYPAYIIRIFEEAFKARTLSTNC